MYDYDLNPGILLGSAPAVMSVLATLATLYLWAVDRARRTLEKIADPAARAVIPWLSPLLLPTLVILGLGFIAGLGHAYEEESWPKASSAVFTAWPAFVIFVFWLKIRKQTQEFIEGRS